MMTKLFPWLAKAGVASVLFCFGGLFGAWAGLIGVMALSLAAFAVAIFCFVYFVRHPEADAVLD